MRESFPNEDELNWLCFSDKHLANKDKFDVDSIINRINFLGGRNESIRNTIYKFVYRKFVRDYETDVSMNMAYEFYLSFIASVEIEIDGKLELCYFKIPAMITFLSTKLKREMVYSVSRNSQEEKMKSFFQLADKYKRHMLHLQYLSRHGTLSWYCSKTRTFEHISFTMVLGVNILLLIGVQSVNDKNLNIGDFPGDAFFNTFAGLLTILRI